jgi:hypothetical protein
LVLIDSSDLLHVVGDPALVAACVLVRGGGVSGERLGEGGMGLVAEAAHLVATTPLRTTVSDEHPA